MTIGERIKIIRNTLDITQDDFAKKLGTARTTVASYEINRREPMEATIKSICREFNVNYDWLKDGIGEMFDSVPETLVDELAQEFQLDDLDKRIIHGYLRLSESDRTAIKRYVQRIFDEK